MTKRYFSVVIPVYNKELAIGATIRSVLAQSYPYFEIVIVNDGSTDQTLAEIEKIDDSRIRIVTQKNAGVAAARNRGIDEAQYEWIALLDGDDEWKTNYLERQAQLIDRFPQAVVTCVNYEMHTADGRGIPTIINKLRFTDEGILDNYFEVASCSNPPICSISIAVKKNAIQSIGGFPVGVKSGEDLLTWARLAARYTIAYSRESLAVFNIEGYARNERPKRQPAEVDVVGEGLCELKREFNPKGIDRYIAFWYKMRSVIYMRLDMASNARKETIKGLRFDPVNIKLWALLFLNLLPGFIRKRVIK